MSKNGPGGTVRGGGESGTPALGSDSGEAAPRRGRTPLRSLWASPRLSGSAPRMSTVALLIDSRTGGRAEWLS
jgi:hypothetical protein